VSGYTIKELEDNVNTEISAGYVPIGGIISAFSHSRSTGKYIQAMTKYNFSSEGTKESYMRQTPNKEKVKEHENS
jgi:hypothetical protein